MAPLGRRFKKQAQQQPSATAPNKSPSPTPVKGRKQSRVSGFPSVLALTAASVSATAIPPTLYSEAAESTETKTTSTNGPSPPRLISRKSAEAVTTVEYAAGESASVGLGERGRRDVSPSASVKTLPVGGDAAGSGSEGRIARRETAAGKRSSWFARKGTWPRSAGVSTTKSPAVTNVAMENASGENLPTAPIVTSTETTSGNGAGKDQSMPLPVETVTLPEPTTQQQKVAEALAQAPKPTAGTKITDGSAAPAEACEATPPASEAGTEESKPDTNAASEAKPKDHPKTSWVGWWYGYPAETEAVDGEGGEGDGDADKQKPQTTDIHVSGTMTPTATTTAPDQPAKEDTEPSTTSTPIETEQKMDDDTASKSGKKDSEDAKREEAKQVAARKGWFGLWGGGAQEGDAEEGKQPQDTVPEETQQEHVPEQVAENAAEEAQSQQPPPVEQTGTAAPARAGGYGLGWFWSQKEEPPASATETKPTVEEGEVAVVSDDSKPPPPTQKTLIKLPEVVVKPLKGSSSTPSLREDAAAPGAPNPKAPATQKSQPPAPSPLKTEQNASTTSLPPTLPSSDSGAHKKLQKILPQNHLLPTFESCYTYPDHPSLLQQLVRYSPIPSFLRPAPPPPENHLYLTHTPPKIRKAVAIGVHGFFPMRLVRTVLGEPTGTSKRFANHAASSIRRWADANSIPVEIETIALEGEGKVADRVVVLWTLLQNWISAVRSADFIVIAAHSQGVPVGMQLLAKMIDEGVVANAQRIAFIGMAGINLGPFGHLPTAMLTGSAKELFEFQKQNSGPSQNYYAALEKVVKHNATRICFVGSIDDQLVPLESSTMTNISHPCIYRAVFVDGRLHTPDFLSHLVGFAMKLRNLGVSDHGLIRELSSPLAGSLYGGEGHSRIYDDGCVYDLGIRHALETTSIAPTPLVVEPFELPTNANPFYLPWSMRGLLEETFVRTRLQKESWELLEQFEAWKPTSKQLKDVKFRLEAVRSKL